MPNVKFNSALIKARTAFCFLFPVLFVSRFVLARFLLASVFIQCIKVQLILDNRRKRKVLPEICFWFMFAITRRFGLVSLFNKKAFSEGQTVYTKVYSAVVRSMYKSSRCIHVFQLFYYYFCVQSRILKTYWFRFSNRKGSGYVHNFIFKDITFDERFQRLMNVASFYWNDFKAVINIVVKTSSVLHFVFFFRDFMKVPLENIKLSDKQTSSHSKEILNSIIRKPLLKKAKPRLPLKIKKK